jgi:hypothetical protein
MNKVKREEVIDLDLLLVQKREVRKLQEFTVPQREQKYDPAKYLASHSKCKKHANADYIELR